VLAIVGQDIIVTIIAKFSQDLVHGVGRTRYTSNQFLAAKPARTLSPLKLVGHEVEALAHLQPHAIVLFLNGPPIRLGTHTRGRGPPPASAAASTQELK